MMYPELFATHNILAPQPVPQPRHSGEAMVHPQNQATDYSPRPERPDERTAHTLARLGIVFQDIPLEQRQNIPDIFATRLNAATQEHLKDLLYIHRTPSVATRGSIQSRHLPGAVVTLLQQAMKDGVPADDATVISLQFLARFNNAVRMDIDITDTQTTEVAAHDLLIATQNNWRDILQQNIKVEKTGPGQARAFLQPPPTIVVEGGTPRPIQDVAELALPKRNGLWVAAGGGADAYTAAFAAQDVFGQEDPVIVSVWGKSENIRNARPIGPTGRIFEARPDTYINGTRYTEDLIARRGLRTLLVHLDRRRDRLGNWSNLPDDFQWIAEKYMGSPSHIAVVDTGGDLLEPSTLQDAKPSRDHLSFHAARRIQERLGNIAGNTFVFVPGVDAPDNMNEIAQQTAPYVYRLTPENAAAYQQHVQRDGMMTADHRRHSRMAQTLWYATHPNVINQTYGTYPLLLPIPETMRCKQARPAFATLTRQMSDVHIYDNRDLARAIGAQ